MPYYVDVSRGPSTSLDKYPPSFGASLSNAFNSSLKENATALIFDAGVLRQANALGKPRLERSVAEQRVKESGFKIAVPDDGYTEEALDILIDRQKQSAAVRSIQERTPWSWIGSPVRGAASLLAGVVDPLNVASAFVPVVREQRMASMLARAGESAVARAGVRAGVGGIEGAAGAAMLEPIVAVMHSQLQDDYGMADSLVNLGFGAILGGGLHMGAGAVADVWRPKGLNIAPADVPDVATVPRFEPVPVEPTSAAALIRSASPEVREVALRAAVADMAQGRVPEVEAVLRVDEPWPTTPRTIPEAADRAEDLRGMARIAYWAQRGGSVLRSGIDEPGDGGMGGAVIGRTTWIPAEEWFGRMRADLEKSGLSDQKKIQAAVEKAIAGEKLNAAETRTLEWMRNEVEDLRARLDPFRLDDADLAGRAFDAGLSSADAPDLALVARAAKIDEAAVERAAMMFEFDDAAFMAEVRRIANEPAIPSQGLDAGRVAQVAERPQTSALADPEASRAADERLKEAPKANGLPEAQAELDKALGRIGVITEQETNAQTTPPTQALDAVKEWRSSGADLKTWLDAAKLPPEIHNLVIGLSELRGEEQTRLLADYARTLDANPTARPEDIAADVVEASRSGRTITPEVKAAKEEMMAAEQRLAQAQARLEAMGITPEQAKKATEGMARFDEAITDAQNIGKALKALTTCETMT